MIFRSLAACALAVSAIMSGGASAQVLLCPDPPPADIDAADIPTETERLLKRLTIALNLHGHRGIDERAILESHASTPSALLAKLAEVASRCTMKSGEIEAFHAASPRLRKAFLEATDHTSVVDAAKEEPTIKSASRQWTEAERVEQSIDLSVRELWRKLWFRQAGGDDRNNGRWAVIVASPKDADSGWDELGKHQRRWKDAYFQLHEPFYDHNPHHAVVVGRRLSQAQAEKLREYVMELGMADDAYIWPLPRGDDGDEAVSQPVYDDGGDLEEGRMNLSVLEE